MISTNESTVSRWIWTNESALLCLNLLSVNIGTAGLGLWKLWLVVVLVLPASLGADVVTPFTLRVDDGTTLNIQLFFSQSPPLCLLWVVAPYPGLLLVSEGMETAGGLNPLPPVGGTYSLILIWRLKKFWSCGLSTLQERWGQPSQS